MTFPKIIVLPNKTANPHRRLLFPSVAFCTARKHNIRTDRSGARAYYEKGKQLSDLRKV